MPRHNNFSNIDMRDMIAVYCQQNFNGLAAKREYLRRYPDRLQPNHQTFKHLFRNLGESGSFRPKRDNLGRPKMITPDLEDEVMVRVDDDSQVSTRRLSSGLGISKTSILKILHREHFHPYHFTPVQNLLPTDLPLRCRFANDIRNRQNLDHSFVDKILFTDEATFTRRGVFNLRNNHYWDIENPHVKRERHFQHEFKINVWCGIIGNHFLGPCELPRNLNGDNYLHFLQNDFIDLLEDLPLNLRQNMWFMQDGAPPHYTRTVRSYLDNNFPERWIGRGSHFPWPPRSPEFNPLDFGVWGAMKQHVYKNVINTRNQLWEEINAATVSFQPMMLFNMRRSFMERIDKCIEENGGHIEHLL